MIVRSIPISTQHWFQTYSYRPFATFWVGVACLVICLYVFAHGCHTGGHDLDLEP